MIDVGDVGASRAVAEVRMADKLDLVVHPLEGAIRHPDPSPRQHAVEVGPEGAGELLERLQAAVTGPPEPLAQMSLGPGGAAIGPESAEILLEEVGSHDRTVQPHERRQARPLVAPEVLRV